MELKSDLEVANTVEKLARLEARYEALEKDITEDERIRALSMISLKRLINQFKEEITRYRAHSANGNCGATGLRDDREIKS
jgi:hypothetical protein